jgi:hypothetical protein
VVLAARVATWTAARQNVFSPGGSRRDVDRSPTECVLSRRLASRRGPQPLFGAPLLKVYAGLIVAPESGAYTVACIDLLTFQEELRTLLGAGRGGVARP